MLEISIKGKSGTPEIFTYATRACFQEQGHNYKEDFLGFRGGMPYLFMMLLRHKQYLPFSKQHSCKQCVLKASWLHLEYAFQSLLSLEWTTMHSKKGHCASSSHPKGTPYSSEGGNPFTGSHIYLYVPSIDFETLQSVMAIRTLNSFSFWLRTAVMIGQCRNYPPSSSC